MNDEDLIVLSTITGIAGDQMTATVVYPSSEQYTFKGWNIDIPNEFPDEDMEFYPITGNNSSITFKSYPGLFPDDKSELRYIGEISSPTPFEENPPPNPTRTGYSFNGWDKAIRSTFPEKSEEVKATWTPNIYELAFYYNGGTFDGEVSSMSFVTYDKPWPTAVSPEKSYTVDFVSAATGSEVAKTDTYNCKFNGYWSNQEADDVQYYNDNCSPALTSYRFENDLSVYANWINPRAPSSGNFTNSFTRVGHDFAGWYEDINRTVKINNYPSLSCNKTLYAKWTPQTYNLTFNYNGGKIGNVSSSTSSITYLGTYPVAPNVTGTSATQPQFKVNFISATTGSTAAWSNSYNRSFQGYYWGNPSASSAVQYYYANLNPVFDKVTAVTGFTVNAKWGNTGRAPASGNFSSLHSPSIAGYRFDGWYESRSSTTPITSYNSLSGDKTLYAKYTLTATSCSVGFSKETSLSGKADSKSNASASKTITISPSELTSVYDANPALKLSKINASISVSTHNHKETRGFIILGTLSSNIISTADDSGKAHTGNVSIAGINNTYNYTKSSTINISAAIWLIKAASGDTHTGNVTAKINSLEFVKP